MTRCLFLGNTAAGSGGMYSNVGYANIDTCIFEGNSAVSGGVFGGLFLDMVGRAELRSTLFLHNEANRGGALGGYNCGAILITDCVFRDNQAKGVDGGALQIVTSDVDILNSKFIDNSALRNGGAVHLAISHVSSISGSYFDSNSAAFGSGSGLYVSAVTDFVVKNNTFMGNQAPFGGGTVFWEASSMPEPFNLSYANHFLSDNSALYGNSVATDAYELSLDETNIYQITDYSKAAPPIVSAIADFYGQVVRLSRGLSWLLKFCRISSVTSQMVM